MNIQQSVESYVMAGEAEKAVHDRRYIDSMEVVAAEVYYEMGTLLLRLCEECFSPDLYEEGIVYFSKAYNAGYTDKEQLYLLMFEISCAPNMESLKENYPQMIF